MKTILKTFVATVVACALVSCNKEAVAPDNNGEYVKVSFLADAQDVSTKATLTPNDEDAVFSSAWEVKDKLSVEYMSFAGEGSSGVVDAVWNGTSFDAVINDGSKGEWSYDAIFPAPQVRSIDFGSSRTQKGNSYNSKYDLMESGAIFFTNAEAGKTDDGKPVKFQMNRQTGIAYFHLKSSLAEETIVSATLSVKGGYIASSSVTVKDYANGYDLSTKDLDSITLTFEDGTAPAADDFKLWFNVLPTDYTSLTLAIETTGHTATITNATAGSYKVGQLYKVAGNIDSKLVATPVEEDKVFFYESFDKTSGTGGNDDKWSGTIASSNIQYDNIGWSATNPGGGNACVKLGSGSKQGSITTPALGITSASATFGFKAGAWRGDTKKITLSASGNATISPNSFDLENEAWTDYSCTISGADATTKITIKAYQASDNRFFLDEVCAYTGKKPVKKTAQVLSFGKTTDYTCYVDEVFVTPELSGAKTDVTYSSSDENVATVDAATGAVTIIAAGSTTIEASAVETEEYRSAYASYKLTVSKRTQAISFEKSHYSVVLADKDNFASPKVSGAETEVTYSITLADGTAADAMTIDSKTGEVTINAIGTATVTATAVETSIYKGNSATYNLKVSESVEAKTVKYSVASVSSVTVSGEAPNSSSVTFKNTYSNDKEQLTAGKNMTFTLSGYAGVTIKKVILSMHSNTSAGKGTFSLVAGETILAEIKTATTFNKWYDSNGYSKSYKDVNVTMTNDSYTIGNGEKVVLIIAATTNSLYCQSVTIVYE